MVSPHSRAVDLECKWFHDTLLGSWRNLDLNPQPGLAEFLCYAGLGLT
jgi:hypothetical protein